VYDSNNKRVHQYFTDSGGRQFSTNTPTLDKGKYTVSIGLFNPNWSSNYSWFDKVSSFQIGTTTNPTSTPQVSPTATPVQNSALRNIALSAYKDWKGQYIKDDGNGALRVIRPENNNDTVSEGIGYGMLLSVYADDETTFSGLLNYTKKHFDSKGLMDWNIDSSGKTIGQGSATDADEDIAYALTLASSKWSGKSYTNDAKNMIQAIMKHEVTDQNLVNPGDNWGTTKTVNPSYLSPSYYMAFGALTGESRWTSVYNATLKWLSQVSNSTTGLVPDWNSSDFTSPDINFDKYKTAFYYDALRTPIRLLHTVKLTNDETAKSLLNKQNSFFKSVGIDKLKSGYTLDGKAITDYLDTAFLSAYAAASQIESGSDFSKATIDKLINDTKPSYFGSTLRALTLMFASL
jgi:endo-1,4-beta-D-glucanase Y